ncbi:MAG: hypothetical protein ACI9TH_000036 [Kiritimatiellia bacterium]|jgi:hypothetical protein
MCCSCAGPRASLQKIIVPVEQLPRGMGMPMIKPSGIPHMRFVNYNPQIFTGRESLEEMAHSLMTPHFDRETLTGALLSTYTTPEELVVYGMVYTTPEVCEAARKTLKPFLQPRDGVVIQTRENRMAIIWSEAGKKPKEATFTEMVNFVDRHL